MVVCYDRLVSCLITEKIEDLNNTHSSLVTLPCNTWRWYSIDEMSEPFRSVLSALVRWVLVERSARGWACVVASILVNV